MRQTPPPGAAGIGLWISTEEATIAHPTSMWSYNPAAADEILLPGENARIKKQLAAAQEEKWALIGRLHEIETQLNAVAFHFPPSTDLDALA